MCWVAFFLKLRCFLLLPQTRRCGVLPGPSAQPFYIDFAPLIGTQYRHVLRSAVAAHGRQAAVRQQSLIWLFLGTSLIAPSGRRCQEFDKRFVCCKTAAISGIFTTSCNALVLWVVRLFAAGTYQCSAHASMTVCSSLYMYTFMYLYHYRSVYGMCMSLVRVRNWRWYEYAK